MTQTSASALQTKAAHQDLANAIRFLAADAVQKANSGHPGMPMGMADVATVLFERFLKFDASAPDWPDRDRFVLSAGHGSMLLYALLYLTGYPGMDRAQLTQFRQLNSKTAGHPEFGHAAGIETTTGPLGQGLATAVGMALSERMLAARYGQELVDHFTYAIAGDGCLMEGISHEAISLAGHLGLGRLIVLFDDNSISIDGPTDLSVSDDQLARFRACGWDVSAVDGHDPEAVAGAIEKARQSDQPSLIACRTIIGYGAPNKEGTAATHGAPLGDDEIAGAKKKLGWQHEAFEIPESLLNAWRELGARGQSERQAWQTRLSSSQSQNAFESAMAGNDSEAIEQALTAFKADQFAAAPTVATRKASQMALDVINGATTLTIGGSADLTGSNNTKTDQLSPITRDDFSGRYIYYGVREHGMAAAMNGIALHGGFIPYGGTFLVFADYARPAIRLSALMKQRVIYVMTHDSIGLGEDGPTHQPVEHLASLRAMPNVAVFRPADIIETAECWQLALENRTGPSVIALTRQGLPTLRKDPLAGNESAKGGYVIRKSDSNPRVSLIATGSEVAIAMDASHQLEESGVPNQVVSLPCWELFEKLPDAHREEILGKNCLRVGIEAAARLGWDRWLGNDGIFIGMDGFGASAPYKDLYQHFGLTADSVVDQVKARV